MITTETKYAKGLGSLTKCICDNPKCQSEFWRKDSQLQHGLKDGNNIQYCNRSCSASVRNTNSAGKYKPNQFIPEGRSIDELSPFRYFHKIIRNRKTCKKSKSNKTNSDCHISLEDIKEVWEKQQGTCPYTGIQLKLPRSTAGFEDIDNECDKASIDRIDSSLPYIKENIQFISNMANYAKNSYNHEEMVKFCKSIAEHWKNTI